MNKAPMISPGNPRSSAIAKKIASNASERSTFFVFPTQMSADSWAEVALRIGDAAAVEMDRFLGWDDFIDSVTASNIPAGALKADQKSRLLWALMILNEQADRPVLRYLSMPGTVPTLSLAASLARIAPFLLDIVSAMRSEAVNSAKLAMPAKKEEIADYSILAAKYSQFLEKHNLYEPCHLEPAQDRTRRFILFEPSLMPGFGKISASLTERCSIEIFQCAERTMAAGVSEAHNLTLLKFGTFREEMQYVLANVAALLENGLQPEDVAISVPVSTPEFQAHAALLARQFALPIEFRSGETLSSSPFGRLLTSLSGASSEGFSRRTMDKLFDCGPFRWKDEESMRKLLRYASRYHIPEFSADKRYMLELWNKTFSSCSDPGASVVEFFLSLRKAAFSIEGARSFSSLRNALYDFKNSFLDDSDLPAEADRTLARIFEELDALEQWHSRLGRPAFSGSPFDILLLELGAIPYKAAASKTANAVSIYPYHVGMLIANPIHFVLDASQNSLDPALRYLSRLPKEMQAYLGENEGGSEALLSSFNAVSAVYCHAERNLSGYSVPHPYFSRDGVTKKTLRGEDIPMLFDSTELRAWRESAPGMMPALQPRNRMEAARGLFESGENLQSFVPPALEGVRSWTSGPLASRYLQKLPACNAAPHIKVSPARLKSITQCPFKWFSTCVPGVDEGPSSLADLAEGSLSHALISTLLLEIAAKDGSLIPSRNEEYMRWLDASFRRVLGAISRQSGPSVEPALDAAYPKIRHRIAHLLDFEASFEVDGWGIGEFEVNLSRVYGDFGLVLEGRADRISTRISPADSAETAGICAVIDFKKKKTPKKRDFLIDASGKLRDFQIASYAAMLEGQGKKVEQALYWSIEEGKPTIVFGPHGARASSEGFETERIALTAALASVSRIISEGSFLAITPSLDACASCPIRSICRAHYSSEHA